MSSSMKNIDREKNPISDQDYARPPREWLRHVWLDFQQMQDFEQNPLIATDGKGMRITTDDGREFIDAIGGAIVSTLGHGNERVRAAMHASIDRQDFWPVLHGTTPAAVRLGRKLAELLPGDLETSFLLTGGSEATETAMKLARQYHRNNGEPTRYKVISRYWSYHGATLGALAASGVGDRKKFEPLPNGFVHVLPPYCYRCPWNKSPDSCATECASAIEQVIKYEGPDTVSAVIADPVMAGAGVLVPPQDYYKKLREICDRYGVLLVFDEVLTGFGRIGSLFACDHYDVVPDLICLGKAMTSGYAPMSAVVARRHIAQAFRGDGSKTFLHGHTYGGYPLGCDTALAVINEITRYDLVKRSAENGEYIRGKLEELAEKHQEIGDIRGTGMIWGMEFVTCRDTKKKFPIDNLLAVKAREEAKKMGLLTRGSPHVLIIAPAITATHEELDEIIDILDRAIDLAR